MNAPTQEVAEFMGCLGIILLAALAFFLFLGEPDVIDAASAAAIRYLNGVCP